jgi:poly(hydroxyalkanoate) depolymerase family esterase
MLSGGEAPGRRVRAAGLVLAVVLLVLAVPRAADAGTVTRLSYGTGASRYSYLVYVPSTYRAGKPLVVFAHGCQTSADQQRGASGYDAVADRHGFAILYADVTAAEAAQPGPLRGCWRFFDPAHWHRGAGDPAAIAGMTRAAVKRWKADPQRVYLVGMSAGGFMTSVLAATYPELYAAVAISAGGAYSDGTCLAGNVKATTAAQTARRAFAEMGRRARVIPRLVMGGDADAGITPPCADKALEQGLRTNNLVLSGAQDRPIRLTPAATRTAAAERPDGYTSTVRTYVDARRCLVGERWLIHGMNHFWPGGDADPAWKSWTDPKGPSGAALSWRFFARFTKRHRC